jgi:hypothetical protein
MHEPVTLLLFRSTPLRISEDYVAAALQNFETFIFLVALRRYPSALTTIAAAIESALQASSIGQKSKDGLQTLLKKASSVSTAMSLWDDVRTTAFRDLRNQIMHRGFSPRDDERSIFEIMKTGTPLFFEITREFLEFDCLEGLHTEYAEHLRVAVAAHEVACAEGSAAGTYWLQALGASVRWSLKDNFQSSWELTALRGADIHGDRYLMHQEARTEIEKRFDNPWGCQCPICLEDNAAVVELDGGALDGHQVVAVRFECINCGYTSKVHEKLLTKELFRRQLSPIRVSILKSYCLVT